jgi:succinate dehydrogenase / fumarate reductase cytochrome b subunit
LQKWFELSGVVPLGVYLVVHVGNYTRSLFGATNYGVGSVWNGASLAPWWLVFELALVWLPLAFHAAYGLYLTLSPREGDAEERTRSLLLRVTGLFSLGFLVQHALWLSLPLYSGERSPADVSEMLAARLSSTSNGIPLAAILHLVGLGAVCAHFGWGLGRFLERWGMASPSISRNGAGILAVCLFLLGAASIVELATGSFVPRFAS